jgi:hypothetical protein
MNLALDLAILRKMAEELPDYLMSDVLFWQMEAPSNRPKLSLGQMLLTRSRLQAAGDRLDAAQRAERDATEQEIEAILAGRQVAAERKAEQELRSRLNLWQRYWEDCREEPRNCADYYPQEVTQRTIAELLLREFPRIAESPEARPLNAVDALARARLQGNRFVWSPELQSGFPEAQFWFLYGLPHYNRA